MSEAMAEWVLLSILEFHRDAHDYRKAQAEGTWIRKEPNIAAETTVAIMGLGAIGSHVAAKVAMLGFRTIGWSRTPKNIPGITSHTGEDGFNTCLAEADFLVSILPLTDDTRDLYDAENFARMKPGAVFINSGRGLQVVEDDLLDALERGPVRAAVLDVFRTEPCQLKTRSGRIRRLLSGPMFLPRPTLPRQVTRSSLPSGRSAPAMIRKTVSMSAGAIKGSYAPFARASISCRAARSPMASPPRGCPGAPARFHAMTSICAQGTDEPTKRCRKSAAVIAPPYRDEPVEDSAEWPPSRYLS